LTGEEIVYLDAIDGYEFEKLCAQIFRKLGWGEVEDVQDVWDEGRDLLIRTPKGELIVVECKHQPQNTIGRPVVQKLHSAVISSKAQKGILITSGNFSQAAIDYAKKISTQTEIELIDRLKLMDLANRAGVKIRTSRNSPFDLFTYGLSYAVEQLDEKMSSLYGRFISHPHPAKQILRTLPLSLELKPLVLIRYNIHVEFVTTVGVIHSIHRDNEVLFIDASNGHPLDTQTAAFLLKSNLRPFYKEPTIPCKVTRGDFKYTALTIKDIAKRYIIQRHTTRVVYRGRNNRTYVKICEPGERNIYIRDVKPILIPVWSLMLRAINQQYHCSLIENETEILVTSAEMFKCTVCGKDISSQALLCNSCGKVTHTPRLILSHGFRCKKCGKTICRSCAYWTRRLVFFKKILCETCASEFGDKKRKMS
jgi:restriction system protein